MNIYNFLTTVRWRQVLNENSWPPLCIEIPVNGQQLILHGVIRGAVFEYLLPALAMRGRLSAGAVTGLQLLCNKCDVKAIINGYTSGNEIIIDVRLVGIPEDRLLCQDYLRCALQDDLYVICHGLERDVEIIRALIEV